MSVSTLSAPPIVRSPPKAIFRRLAIFRFSLRELFLVMTACAAFSAWGHGIYEMNKPLRPTPMAEYFMNGLAEDVVAVRSELGEEGVAWSFPPFLPQSLDEFDDGKSANRDWSCNVRLPWNKSDKFRDGLRRKIQSHLTMPQPGDHISEKEFEMESEVIGLDYFGMTTRYHYGDVHGVVRLYVVRTDEQRVCLIATLNERR